MSGRRRRRRSRRALRTAVLGAVVTALALLPLYGDSTPGDAVTHPEWARMVLRGLDLLGGDAATETASLAFATLSGRDSRSWDADRYVRGSGIEVVARDEGRVVRPTGLVGEAVYPLAVARGGDYHLRLHVAGPSAAEAEIAPVGEAEVIESFLVPAEPVMGWIDAGIVHLDPGAYDTSVLLPEGATLEHIELAPPCLHPIEPPEGWQPTALATTHDVAVTVLQALDAEFELPPAAPPLEYRGSDLQLEEGSQAVEAAESPLTEGSFRGGPRGAEVVLLAEIPEDGLYTLSVFGQATGGQRWMVDGCRKSVVCPSTDPLSHWRVVLSGVFAQGTHLFEASLGPGTAIERIRFEEKKDDPADYVATLERLGLELGPEGPITREKAEEARRFLERRRGLEEEEFCGDILAPGTLISQLTATGPGGEGGGGGIGPGGGDGDGGDGGGDPIPPPVIPPIPPGSGVLPLDFEG
jgi:hypothetical protein